MAMIVLKILLMVVTFFIMEFVAWASHKYIMHGFLWSWHRSHHRHHQHALEKNDLFAVVFSIPSITTIALGTYYPNLEFLLYIGIGILGYGVFYFIFHDILVHRRIKIKFNPKRSYMKRIMNAHYIHHKKHTKEGCEAFGFLYASKKYDKKDS